MNAQTIRDKFLSDLTCDDAERARFVETLRCTASALRGRDYTADVRHELAGVLLDAAASLCDHARIRSDGRCRYCEAIVIHAGA